jgi:undecaprenyl diphosphate synthase
MKKIETVVPRHIAFILDGNRRWAKARGMSTLEGHSHGYDNLITVAKLSLDRGVEYLSAYVFSTENWNRSPEEVTYLMGLVRKMVTDKLQEIIDLDVRLKWTGSRTEVAPDLAELIDDAVKKTSKGSRGQMNLCFNYGGKRELVDAMKNIVANGEEITEASIAANLYTSDSPDIDLLVRTSGEQRLSNFMPWQSTYAELYFTEVMWPDFDEIELDKALDEFTYRQRRHGK